MNKHEESQKNERASKHTADEREGGGEEESERVHMNHLLMAEFCCYEIIYCVVSVVNEHSLENIFRFHKFPQMFLAFSPSRMRR